MVNKSVLYNADGTFNVQKSNEVLGQDVPFAGEYGISREPESFVSFGNFMSWTDSRRGKVLKLGGNGLFPTSSWGMNSWFRNIFKSNKRGRYISGYDPYMDQMILSVAPKDVEELMVMYCGQEIKKFQQDKPFTYLFKMEQGVTSIMLKGEGQGMIVIEGKNYTMGGNFEINHIPKAQEIRITVEPNNSSYSIQHVCTIPEVVQPPVEQPVDTGQYFGYLAVRCAEPGKQYYPEIITSVEQLDERLSGRVAMFNGRGYTLIDVSQYSMTSVASNIHLEQGNNGVFRDNCPTTHIRPPLETFDNDFQEIPT